MAFLSRFARKVQDSLKVNHIPRRAYSASNNGKLCYIMGNNGPIALSGHRMIGLDEHSQKRPLLCPAATDRLIDVNPDRPYICEDFIRQLYSSGLSLPYFAGLRKESYSGAFRKDNVGVIEELCMFGFKELVQDDEQKWLNNSSAGFNEYGDLLKELLNPHLSYNGSVVVPPDDIEMFCARLSGAIVDVELIMVDPATLTDLEYALVAQEVYRILYEERPAYGDFQTKVDICRYVGENSDRGSLTICQNHAFLNAFLPLQLRNPMFLPYSKVDAYNDAVHNHFGVDPIIGRVAGVKRRVQGPVPYPVQGPVQMGSLIFPPNFSGSNSEVFFQIGSLLIGLNRHMGVHSIKKESGDSVRFLPKPSERNLLNNPPTRAEVIRLGRYEFGKSLSLTLEGFKTLGIPAKPWTLLDVRKLIPVPSIYFSEGK